MLHFKKTAKGRVMRFLPKLLSKAIRKGRLEVIGPQGEVHVFGGQEPGPDVGIKITDPAFDWKIFLNPELHAAEAYMDGKLQMTKGEVIDFLTIFFVNKRSFDMSPKQIALNQFSRKLRRFKQFNPVARSLQNVKHHYDLGNDLYQLFLDEDLNYSCAYFPKGDETLEEAQRAKQRHIAAKLDLQDGQRVLDIGCGWGSFALYMAQVADVEVLGVTLSEEQLALATKRAADMGLSDRVPFKLMDYRAVEGQFDRISSIGMLEHVGMPQLLEYFLTVRDRLKPDGLALIHSISSKAPPGITGPFIAKYIFPGGYSPSLSETFERIEKSGLWALDCEIWRVHYGTTLKHWRERFMANRDKVAKMYDERFCRMWEFYLAACEGAFFYGSSHVFQIQLARERDAAPLGRDYITEREAELAAKGL